MMLFLWVTSLALLAMLAILVQVVRRLAVASEAQAEALGALVDAKCSEVELAASQVVGRSERLGERREILPAETAEK